MHRLVSYDIADDKLRLKASKILIRRGLIRIQMSVFVGALEEIQYNKLQDELKRFIQSSMEISDKILILDLAYGSLEKALWLGDKNEEIDEIIGEIDELFF